MNLRLPVTLVGGFLGAGKTSVLHHLVGVHQGGHLVIMVENPGALNVDAKALRGLCGAMRRKQDRVLEIPSGNEETQLEWLAEQLRESSASGQFERVLIEVGGTTSPARWTSHFGLVPGQSKTFTSLVRLSQVIVVVDALDFYRTVVTPPEKIRNPLRNFQIEQIESASLLILNKCDLVDDATRETCTRLLRKINSEASIIETDYGEVPPEVLLRPGTVPKLLPVMQNDLSSDAFSIVEDMDTAPLPLGSALYRAYRPFHPERLWAWFNAEHVGLLRMKGLIWLATRHLLVGGISRTLWQNGCGAAGIWWAGLPREEWPEDLAALGHMQETWREPYGDRRQELILIGEQDRLGEMIKKLDACLLTAAEYEAPLAKWMEMPDPFPRWDLEEN